MDLLHPLQFCAGLLQQPPLRSSCLRDMGEANAPNVGIFNAPFSTFANFKPAFGAPSGCVGFRDLDSTESEYYTLL